MGPNPYPCHTRANPYQKPDPDPTWNPTRNPTPSRARPDPVPNPTRTRPEPNPRLTRKVVIFPKRNSFTRIQYFRRVNSTSVGGYMIWRPPTAPWNALGYCPSGSISGIGYCPPGPISAGRILTQGGNIRGSDIDPGGQYPRDCY